MLVRGGTEACACRQLLGGVQVPSAVEGFPHAVPKCWVLQEEIAVSLSPSSFSLACVFAGGVMFECPVWLLGVCWRLLLALYASLSCAAFSVAS